MGVRDYDLQEDYGRQDRPYNRDRRARDRDEREYERDDREYERDNPTVYERAQDRKFVRRQGRRHEDEQPDEPRKESLAKREPVRLAGAVVTLITAGALVLFGIEVTSEQQTQIQELILLAIPIITPLIAGFEIARSKVDSPATVERKLREERYHQEEYR